MEAVGGGQRWVEKGKGGRTMTELEAEMELRTDVANVQMLFMGCALDHSLEQLAQKEKKKSKKGFRLQGGKPSVLTDKEVIDAVEREEVGKLAQAAQKAANKLS